MTLAPKLPPGRATRKALQFAVDIHRLRNAGYTFSAIRAALVDAGISVSLTTIKREAARRGTAALRVEPVGVAPCQPPSSPATPPKEPGANGRDIAEAFFTANPSNPLLRSKESP